ncbi:MAG TPA: 50S ribosomal protein L18 [Chloroflexota bacterium]|nr:50S ribosomal protein L18 [Chloroflexota bacterium]
MSGSGIASSLRRRRRRQHIRRRIFGTGDAPRLSVFRSSENIYAQLIDDSQSRTLASASTLDKSLRTKEAGQGKRARAEAVGKLMAERAKEAGITRVVFDRGGYLYHGRVKALAEGARSGGLEF